MSYKFSAKEVTEVLDMLLFQNLDIRAVTLSINISPAISHDINITLTRIEKTMKKYTTKFYNVVNEVSEKYGVKIVTKRLSLTPISLFLEPLSYDLNLLESKKNAIEIAKLIDKIAVEDKVDFVGGYAAFVHKGETKGDVVLMESLPEVLASTKTINSMINVASTQTGINMDAVRVMAKKIKEVSEVTENGIGCTRLVVSANTPEDNPFMPGGYHGFGENEASVNVAISGPGVIENVVRNLEASDFRTLHEAIKRAAFKVTRLGELVGRKVAESLGVAFGSVDISLAPSPKIGDSIAGVIEAMGLESAGVHGTILALAILTDAVKKGGAMAVSHIGGLSGAFIPVSEDSLMTEAFRRGSMSIEELHALSAVCNTGVDMVAIPGGTPVNIIAGIIADEMAIAVTLDKSLGVRIIPVPGKKEGEEIDFGGLLGKATIVKVRNLDNSKFVERKGVVPPFVERLRKG
ncbi:MAG: PFL family protein [Thermoproteota archaeon]